MSTVELKEPKFYTCEGCWKRFTSLFSGLCQSCLQDRNREHERKYEEAALEARRQDRQGTLSRAGVPSRHAKLEFDSPKVWPSDPRCPDMLLSSWNGEPWSVLLTGPTGTGKTSLAVELLLRWLCYPGAGRFVRARRLPGLYFSDDASEIRDLETVGLLIVDDLGRGHLGRAWEAVGEIMNSRYDEELSTIITSNLGLAEIAEHDAHMADRLSEGLVIRIGGDSRRAIARDSRRRTGQGQCV